MKSAKTWRIISLICACLMVAVGIASFFSCRWIININNNSDDVKNPAGIVAIAFAMAIVAAMFMILSLIFIAVALVPMVIKIVQASTQKDGLSYATAVFNTAFALVSAIITILSVADTTFNWLFFSIGLFGMLVSILGLISDILLIVSYHRERRRSITCITIEDDSENN